MVEENIKQEQKLKDIDKTRNFFFEEIEQNELMSKNHKKVYTTLNYIEHCLILDFTITGVFQFLLLLLFWISYRNYEFCAITAGIFIKKKSI